MSKSRDYLLEKFPDQKSKILRLYEIDEDFKALCDDFLTTAEEIEKYREQKIKNKDYENEFSHVYSELEKEIIRVLIANKPSS